MIIKFIGVVLLFAAPYGVFCQKNNSELPESTFTLRLNILGLVDPLDYNLTFGLEKRFNTNWSAGTDAGWVFSSAYIRNAKKSTGFIFRPFIRYYPNGRNTFWEAELHYKYVTYKIEDWVGRNPVNNVPAYEEYTLFNLNKQSAGLHIKWGVQANISNDKRLKFDFAMGLGVRFKSHKVPGGTYTTGGVFSNITTETYVGPVIPVSARLVYVLK